MPEPAVVAVVASTRADLYPLSPVLGALAAATDLAVSLLTCGTIHHPDFDDPLAGVDLKGVELVEIAPALGSSEYAAMVEGGLGIAEGMAAALRRLEPAAVVVLGDRWELLYAVPPIVLAGVPLVHLHGGEVTEGAIDDRIRHAVTKLADVHCTSTEEAAARLRRLGEPPERVHVTGAPSLDRVAAVEPASEDDLAELLGRHVRRPLALVTYHPATAGGSPPGAGARAVLQALAGTVGSVVVTHPGLDAGREEVLAEIERTVATEESVVAVAGLGPRYLPVLAAADVVVGNSSSGILEAASFGVPVVDVGDRQRGRVAGANVVRVPEDRVAIARAVRTCLQPAFRERAVLARNPYGDGRAAPRVVEAIRQAVRGGLERKRFVDPEPDDAAQ